MKKILSLIIAFLICISFCSCGGAENTGENNSNKEITITKEELVKYSEYIELTTENWEDFFEIIESEVTVTDAFGEETSIDIDAIVSLKNGYFISEDNALRFSHYTEINSDNKMTRDIVFTNDALWEDRRIRYICSLDDGPILEKAKGTILKITVPDEKWNTNEYGYKYLIIKDFGEIYSYDAVYDTFI